jgi:hypothetical protein
MQLAYINTKHPEFVEQTEIARNAVPQHTSNAAGRSTRTPVAAPTSSGGGDTSMTNSTALSTDQLANGTYSDTASNEDDGSNEIARATDNITRNITDSEKYDCSKIGT